MAVVRVPVSRWHSRGFVASGAVVCSISLPTHVSGSARSPGRPAFSALVHGVPSRALRRSRRLPRRCRAPRKGFSSSPVSGFFQARVSGFLARPQGRLRGRASLVGLLQKRLIAGDDVGHVTCILSPAPGRSRVRPSGFGPLGGSSSLSRPWLLRLHGVLPSRPCLRGLQAFCATGWPASPRPSWSSAHCPPPFPKGTGDRQREHPRGCSRVRVLHQRRFPSRSRCLISDCPGGRNPAAPRSVGALPARGLHFRVALAAPSLSLGSPGGPVLSVPALPSIRSVGCMHGWLLLAAKTSLP